MRFGASEANEFSILFIFGSCFIRFDSRDTFACAKERSIWLLVCFRFKKLFTRKRTKGIKMKFAIIAVLFACSLVMPVKCNRINSKVYEEMLIENQNHIIEAGSDTERAQAEMPQENPSPTQPNNKDMLAYVKTSIPTRIFRCMQRLNLLKCMKIFILQRMERSPMYRNSGNLTSDFLDQILSYNQNNSDDGTINEEVLDKYYLQMTEVEINERLLKSFQRFFHDREIKLHFIPGMVVNVVPNEDNAINLSLKRGKCSF